MKIEHIAYQVEDPASVTKWYVENLGFSVKRQSQKSPFMHFMADDSGSVMIEIYSNPAVDVPDYAKMDPLLLHLALVSEDVEADRQRLIASGATAHGEITFLETGDTLAMLRDPWGFPLQLCHRKSPMI